MTFSEQQKREALIAFVVIHVTFAETRFNSTSFVDGKLSDPWPLTASIRPLRTETEPENREDRTGDQKNRKTRRTADEIARIRGLEQTCFTGVCPIATGGYICIHIHVYTYIVYEVCRSDAEICDFGCFRLV